MADLEHCLRWDPAEIFGRWSAEKINEPLLGESSFDEFAFRITVPEQSANGVPEKMRIALAAQSGSNLTVKSIKAETNIPQ